MLLGKQIISSDKLSKIKLVTSALEFPIDFSWLNDFRQLKSWDASVKLAMALELANYLGLINIKDSPQITPKLLRGVGYQGRKLQETYLANFFTAIEKE